MAGATKTRPSRTPAPSRFARPGGSATRSAPQTRIGRPSAPSLRRRKPQQKGLKKMLGSVLPGAAAKKAAPSSKKGAAGGLALAAAAAGMAFKNRGKLGELRKGKQQDRIDATSPTTAMDGSPSTPAASPTTPPL